MVKLPIEIWELVHNFLRSNVLAGTCWQLRTVGKKHIHACRRRRIEGVLYSVQVLRETVQTLAFDCGAGGMDSRKIPALVEALTSAPHLHSLEIDMHDHCLKASDVQVLAGLKPAPSLRMLTINLAKNNVGNLGAKNLAALKESRTLQTLCIDLSFNGIHNSGVRALAQGLREAQQLRTLVLNLTYNRVSNKGAQALVVLKDAPNLHTLSISLSKRAMHWGQGYIRWLKEIDDQLLVRRLREAPNLHDLNVIIDPEVHGPVPLLFTFLPDRYYIAWCIGRQLGFRHKDVMVNLKVNWESITKDERRLEQHIKKKMDSRR
eukprot:CAMPEP_0174289428 /NCGR_PEP_ID=MMETSP0809-20121228/25028_1 /TAXON_ID=73025 ORGANISM="Eutreptiella gymnastica-like, Strain CCMP1594" /NCGR_SAMPLE_ID=MMETSP0809 /ASSEMBLY_ACC=CAM_ASM_000658 /LENGTH=318 /DNA_ID=CAMNT_0015387381 /DNA_START=173 /DNA_END=1130 /DNA_ORIENTATION=+